MRVNMNIKLIIILLLFLSIKGYSQQNIAFADGAFDRSSSFITISDDDTVDVEGSKYINPDYKQALISIYDGYKFNVKYNAFDDEMEVEGKDNKSFALNKNEKKVEVTFIDKNLTYCLFDYVNTDGETKTGYFQKLVKGKNTNLLKKEKIMFIEEKQSKTGYDAYRPPQFKRLNDKYFIKLYNNDFVVLLPKNKKLFANLYPESKSEVLAFIKEKKVKPKMIIE